MPETVTVTADHVELPASLADELGRLVLFEEGPFVARFSALRLAKRLARRRRTAVRRLRGRRLARPGWVEDGTYRIVNYDPHYFLVRSLYEDDAEDREAFWSQIPGYHEHLPPQQQAEDARRFSDWFARDVIAPLEPATVLEVGCGAGRNLAALRDAGIDAAGVEINPAAVAEARTAGLNVSEMSLYGLGDVGRFDVVFTAGVLMHVPHEQVDRVVKALVHAARRAVVHFELHGDGKPFDFHRYPRDYRAVYQRLGLAASYRVLDRSDPLNRGESVGRMALLVHLTSG